MGLIKTIGHIMEQLQVDGDTLYVEPFEKGLAEVMLMNVVQFTMKKNC